jgi:hypothetical protein
LEYSPAGQYYGPEDATGKREKNEAVNADEALVSEQFGNVRKIRFYFRDAKFGSVVTNWHQTDTEP